MTRSSDSPRARALLLGGEGLVGSRLGCRLAEHGTAVWSLDNGFARRNLTGALLRTHELAVDRLHQAITGHLTLSITDHDNVRALIERTRPNTIYVLAALLASESRHDPRLALEVHVDALRNVLDVATAMDPMPRIVFASSSYIYGDFDSPIIDERHARRPFDPYGRTKLIGEELIALYATEHGLPFSIARPAAIYGAGDARPRFLSRAIEAALCGEPVVVTDPDFVSDFTYVDDAVDGLVRMGTHDSALGETFNLTFGNAASNRDAHAALQAAFPHHDVQLSTGEEEPGLVLPRRGALDCSKARTQLGYAPRYDLRAGIAAFCRDWRSLHDVRNVELEPSHGASAVGAPR